jgi:dihydrofolate reductase/thymidylate synthase
MFELVVATDLDHGIGKNGNLPWPRNKEDMSYFKNKTTEGDYVNFVIMGRKTWNSIPKKFRPLPGRRNIVLSRTLEEDEEENYIVQRSMRELLKYCDKQRKKKDYKKSRYFVIGGAEIYKQFLDLEIVSKIWHTKFFDRYECDTFLEEKYFEQFEQSSDTYFSCGKPDLTFYELIYTNKQEKHYLEHVQNILDNGKWRNNRTGEPTISLFSPNQLRFNIRNHRFPLLTTKACWFKGIFEELKMYISGNSDSKYLEDQGINVWQGNTTREFLDNKGLKHYKEGDMGPSYSFNFRHFSADYKGCEKNYTGQGFDQVKYCIDLIKNNPMSRRILISLWDPSKLDEMALPPCMFQYQFYVDLETDELSCFARLRSSDTFLGLPWNIGTVALFTHMMARECGKKTGDIIISIGDAHLYKNQIKVVKKQLERTANNFPVLFFKETDKSIFDMKFKDIELLCYKNCGKLDKVEMIA